MKVICFPHAGAGAAFFHGWPAPDGLTICPVCLPGREGRIRDTPFDRMAPLLDWLEADLAPLLAQPHVMLGHSMGGVVAHALCQRRLMRGAMMPRALAVSACPAPGTRRRAPLHRLDDAAFLKQLQSFDPDNAALARHPELWDLLAPVLRADFAVIETYRTSQGPVLPLPIVALAGRSDPLLSPEDMSGWAATGTGYARHAFDGGHFYLKHHAADVLRILSDFADQPKSLRTA